MFRNNILKIFQGYKILKYLVVVSLFAACSKEQVSDVSVLYWNIQNGMWSEQTNNYDNFVAYVKGINPDICVWTEAQTLYENDTNVIINPDNAYLVDGWGELAQRYGHKYWCVSGQNDEYPQVITSKYPIECVKRIFGTWPDQIVVHGSCWVRIKVNRRKINIVPVHLWAQEYAFSISDDFDYNMSEIKKEGDKYRLMEMKHIFNETIKHNNINDEAWLFIGDYNTFSIVDNTVYDLPKNDTEFLVHEYIRSRGDLYDLMLESHPGTFSTTHVSGKRLDYIYASKLILDNTIDVGVIVDDYTTPKEKGMFYTPSDHYPIYLRFNTIY